MTPSIDNIVVLHSTRSIAVADTWLVIAEVVVLIDVLLASTYF